MNNLNNMNNMNNINTINNINHMNDMEKKKKNDNNKIIGMPNHNALLRRELHLHRKYVIHAGTDPSPKGRK